MAGPQAIRRALGGRTARTAAVALVAAAIGGGTVAAVDGTTAPAAAPAPAAPTLTTTPVVATSSSGDLSAVYSHRRAGVVTITSTVTAAGPGGGVGTAQGSGVVIDRQGHVLTNEHVVAGGHDITVELADGTRSSATVVGSDASTDLAVLKIDVPASKLSPIPLGDSSAVRVGEEVLAIGDPFGYDGSASAGIVSGLGRSIQAPNGFTITGAIQTDAAVNHGNSGGALLDADGNLIGIPAQIADSGVDANVGVAFAIPSNTARQVVSALLSDGTVAHAWLGVGTATVDGRISGVGASRGALITGVVAGGPAADAGLQGGTTPARTTDGPLCVGGDVITAVGDTTVADASDLQSAIDAQRPGATVDLTVVAPDGSQRHVPVTLGTRPASTQDAPAPSCG